MPRGNRVFEEPPGLFAIGGHDARYPPRSGNAFECIETLEQGPVDEVFAIERETVEEPHLAPDRLAVENEVVRRK